MACDPATLTEQAKCINSCIPPGMQTAVLIALFCEIRDSLTTGGGAGQQVYIYVGAAPAFNPNNPALPAIAYSEGGAFPNLNWNVTTQNWE